MARSPSRLSAHAAAAAASIDRQGQECHGKALLRERRRSGSGPSAQGGDHRLRLAGPCPCAEPARLRRRRPCRAEARARPRGPRPKRPGCASSTVAEAAAEADLVMILLPDTEQARGLRGRDRPPPRRRRRGLLRSRVQHPLRAHQPAAGRRRRHGRPEGPGPPRAPHLHRRRRGAVAHRRVADASGKAMELALVLRRRPRGHPRRRARDDLRGGDRDGPLRRAGRALRRR